MKDHRKRDIASYQNIFCFTPEEIHQYKFDDIDPEKRSLISRHLNRENCLSCRNLYESLMERDLTRQEELHISTNHISEMMEKLVKNKTPSLKSTLSPLFLETGQIWTTLINPKDMAGNALKSAEIAIPVVILDSGSKEKKLKNVIRVAPISLDTEFHNDGDDVILDASNPLGYSVLIEIWNEKQMLAGNLGEYRGDLAEEDLSRIKTVRDALSTSALKDVDVETSEWRRKELELTDYLNRPVSERFRSLANPRTIDRKKRYSFAIAALLILGIGLGIISELKKTSDVGSLSQLDLLAIPQSGNTVTRGKSQTVITVKSGEEIVLRSGDQLRLQLKADQQVYVAILWKDSSGRTMPFFNELLSFKAIPHKLYTIPEEDRGSVELGGERGLEMIIVLLSPDPLDNLAQNIPMFGENGWDFKDIYPKSQTQIIRIMHE